MLNRIFKLGLFIIALIILGVSLYVNTRGQQRNANKVEQVRTEQVQQPTPTPTQEPQTIEKSATTSGLLKPPSNRTERRYQYTVSDIQEEIRRVFEAGYETDWALFLSDCESTNNPFAVNPAGYYGLFQYSAGTYKACGGSDIWDWREQILVTKKCMFDHGRQNEFPRCNEKWNLGR